MQPQDKSRCTSSRPASAKSCSCSPKGYSMKQVADMLNVTPRTVQFHKYRMMQQLGIKSSAELIQFAVRQHIV